MEFLNLPQITVEAAVIIASISLIRFLFGKKLNPNIRYFLWIFVAMRILIPFKLDFAVNLPESPVMTRVADLVWVSSPLSALRDEGESSGNENFDLENDIEMSVIPAGNSGTGAFSSAMYEEGGLQRAHAAVTKEKIFFFVWLCGAVFLALYVLIGNFILHRTLRAKRRKIRRLKEGIPLYAMKGYNCLTGVLFPAIYVDADGLKDSVVIKDVIRHELQHYRVRDNYWQFIRILCLIAQWHNPFVWWAYSASRKDCEMACDARVVRRMSEEQRYQYGSSLLTALECAIRQKQNIGFHTSMGANKKFISERIRRIMKYKYKKTVLLSALVIACISCICFVSVHVRADERSEAAQIGVESDVLENTEAAGESGGAEAAEETESSQETEDAENDIRTSVQININEHYITNTGDASNLYYIDENQVLWGCGRNNYGQLGQGNQDYDFHEEMVKIAEDVIHIDYSQTGFTIYLTEEHKLYGMGNAGCGALQQFEEFDWSYYVNGEHYTVTEPVLLMENVIYARCGRSDIACLLEDGSVWIWGTVGFNGFESGSIYEAEPVKVLENAVLVTGGLFNHAVLLEDGSVWTWGYNYSGNCGVADEVIVARPRKVIEDAIMVWTGSTKYNVDCYDISEFGGVYERFMDNTLVQKRDGSYWICGANVGTEEKILPIYYEAVDYSLICTHEFQPYDGM